MKKLELREKIILFVVFFVLIIFALMIIYPLIWMTMSGFKTNKELFLETWKLPNKLIWNNYVRAWNAGVGKYFLNSIIVTSASVFFTILISSTAAFSLARFEFKWKKVILVIVIGGLMLSPQVSLTSLYKLLQKLGIYNTYLALIVPYVAYRIPFTTFLIYSYMLSLPREIEDSAYIDGCSSWMVFRKMILPMSRPILATAALFTAMSCWNEFMFALVFIESDTLRTIPVGLMNLRSTLSTDWSVLMAGLTLSVLPMVLLFLIFQKQFVRGITSGGVKG